MSRTLHRAGRIAWLAALSFTFTAACGDGSVAGPTEPLDRTTRARPFTVQLDVNDLDALSDRCQVRVIADARGGSAGAFAEWDHLTGSSLDPDTGELIGVPRTQELFPDVFSHERIEAGESQQGVVDLELYRRQPDEQVVVRLQFRYRVADDGTGNRQERTTELFHTCQ